MGHCIGVARDALLQIFYGSSGKALIWTSFHLAPKSRSSDFHAFLRVPGARYGHYAATFYDIEPTVSLVVLPVKGHDVYQNRPDWVHVGHPGTASILRSLLGISDAIQDHAVRETWVFTATSNNATALVMLRVFTLLQGRLTSAAHLKHAMPCTRKRLGTDYGHKPLAIKTSSA